ncbi:DNA-3-methyladenine glycosylase 2 [Kineococcus rhizosphaerae]|uniref:DNA-3-methyladenine glycosylase II n=1 Tax=Kineococcus rhizosphaerae TaxID=559628 RepID=A0A2T0QXJ7_9ACTN|nr:AlkA N-terminal domain-containing protein [Kineococcus rhizosphaerae]PRY10761.1 DNA-3-methyladenine glycosylase II [Kineococcus rhizosphaerae]
MKLDVPGGLPAEPLRRWLAAHAVPGAETHVDGVHRRVFPGRAGGLVEASVDLGTADRCDVVVVEVDGEGDVDPALVRRWLDLDGDHVAAERHLSGDPLLAPLVAANPGLRVPRAVSGSETALLTVLGQQVSLAAARTFAGRLVAAHGTPVGALRAFPEPAALAAAGPDALRAVTGVTGARARTLHALASAFADGLDLETADPAAARAELLALPGIGPWTVDYVSLRVFGDSDAFLPSDLVLRRALGRITAREAAARAEAWRPWRGYALLHLWTAEVFTD